MSTDCNSERSGSTCPGTLIEEGYGYASFAVRSYRLSGLASAEPSKAAN
jgi:hypothetical protein